MNNSTELSRREFFGIAKEQAIKCAVGVVAASPVFALASSAFGEEIGKVVESGGVERTKADGVNWPATLVKALGLGTMGYLGFKKGIQETRKNDDGSGLMGEVIDLGPKQVKQEGDEVGCEVDPLLAY